MALLYVKEQVVHRSAVAVELLAQKASRYEFWCIEFSHNRRRGGVEG